MPSDHFLPTTDRIDRSGPSLVLGGAGDEQIRLSDALAEAESSVLRARDAEVARRLVQDHEILLLVAVLTGTEDDEHLAFCAELQHLQPSAFRLVIGPTADVQLVLRAVNHGHAEAYLPRSWRDSELSAYLRYGLETGRSRRRRSGIQRVTQARMVELEGRIRHTERRLADRSSELARLRKRLHDYQAELSQLELQGSLTQLVRGLAHELNNPLTAILGHAQRLQRGPDREDVVRRAATVVAEVQRCIDLVERLRNYAVPPSELSGPVEVVEAMELGRDRLEQRRIATPPIHYRKPLPRVSVAPRSLSRAIEQILDNAVRAGASRIDVSAERERDRVLLHIDNDGATPDPDAVRHAAQPFFTTWADRGCSGLGLSLASSVLREMGGSLVLDRRLDDQPGARCTIALPAADAPDDTPLASMSLPGGVGTNTIMVVDDEPLVAEVVTDMLAELGCAGVCCSSRTEALERLPSVMPSALLVDVKLPDGDGGDLLALVLERWPDLRGRVALVTGDPGDATVDRLARELSCPILGKPFRMTDVQKVLQQILA